MKFVFAVLFVFVSTLSMSCAKSEKFSAFEYEANDGLVDNPATNPQNPPSPSNPNPGQGPVSGDYSKMEAVSWEAKAPSRRTWSHVVYKVIEAEEPQMLAETPADDISEFCPRYRDMNKSQRLNFWGELISAMSYFEASWKPTTRFWEKSMGIDPVTGQNVYSEGLLQLSYQDTRAYKFCEFDWSKDKHLAATDPNKTIFDPAKNLRCGVKILALQLKKQKYIGASKGVYWAVLYRGNSRNKIAEISRMTRSLSFCE